MALHELEVTVPPERQDWTDVDYAAEMLMYLGLARAVERLDLSLEEQSKIWQGAASREEAVHQSLVPVGVLAVEWGKRRGWQITEDFGLKLDWQKHDLPYLMARTSDAITQTHWSASNSNPGGARVYLNMIISCVEDYFRARNWHFEEEVMAAINGNDYLHQK